MQCGRVSKHVQMQTVKTALILSRTSSLQGSALGLLVHNDYPHIKCRERRHSGVYAGASTTAKPGMPGLLKSHDACCIHMLCDPCCHEGVPVCVCFAESLEEASKTLRCPELPHVCNCNSSAADLLECHARHRAGRLQLRGHMAVRQVLRGVWDNIRLADKGLAAYQS